MYVTGNLKVVAKKILHTIKNRDKNQLRWFGGGFRDLTTMAFSNNNKKTHETCNNITVLPVLPAK